MTITHNAEIVDKLIFRNIYKAELIYSDSRPSDILYDCGLDGIDLRFLEYGMGYLNIPEDENPQSILNLLPSEVMSDLEIIDSEYKRFSDLILPTQYLMDGEFSGNNIGCFGSYSIGSQITYVIFAPEEVKTIKLWNNPGKSRWNDDIILQGEDINDKPIKTEPQEVFIITLGEGGEPARNVAEVKYKKVIFIAVDQSGSGSFDVSYHAWSKLVNPIRKFNTSTLLEKDFTDPVQFEKEELTSRWYDLGSHSILGMQDSNDDVASSLPILARKRSNFIDNPYSPWKEYKNNEEAIWDGDVYVSLKDHNLGNCPAVSKYWILKTRLTDFYTYRVIPRLYPTAEVGSPDSYGEVNPKFYNVLPWTKNIRFEVYPNIDKGYNLQKENSLYKVYKPYEDSDLYYIDYTLPTRSNRMDRYLNIMVEPIFTNVRFFCPTLYYDNFEIRGYKGSPDEIYYPVLDIIDRGSIKISVPITTYETTTKSESNGASILSSSEVEDKLRNMYRIKILGEGDFDTDHAFLPPEDGYSMPRSIDGWNSMTEELTDFSISRKREVGDFINTVDGWRVTYTYSIDFYLPLEEDHPDVSSSMAAFWFTKVEEYIVVMSNSGDIAIQNPYNVVPNNGNIEIRFKPYKGKDLEPDRNGVYQISRYLWINKDMDDNGNIRMATSSTYPEVSLRKSGDEYIIKIQGVKKNYKIDVVL